MNVSAEGSTFGRQLTALLKKRFLLMLRGWRGTVFQVRTSILLVSLFACFSSVVVARGLLLLLTQAPPCPRSWAWESPSSWLPSSSTRSSPRRLPPRSPVSGWTRSCTPHSRRVLPLFVALFPHPIPFRDSLSLSLSSSFSPFRPLRFFRSSRLPPAALLPLSWRTFRTTAPCSTPRCTRTLTIWSSTS